jgi:thiamine-monophosphate kinase
MNVSDLGEFGLIERLKAALGSAGDGRLVTGIGDDAAVWCAAGGTYTVATTDTMVAGVHFLPDRVSWADVGWKALAVNVSDIAAMGAQPLFALVTLCLPRGTPLGDIDALYVGLRECAEAYGVAIAGGDIVSSPVFAITVALTGTAAPAADGAPTLLLRRAAREGDLIAVSGPLGGSAGGLRALLHGDAGSYAEALISRHMRPQPRIDIGQAAVNAGVRCGIDISDGLVQDIGHVCAASGVGAELRLDALPLDPALVAAYPADAAMMAATGGEDYELVLVGPEGAMAALGATLTIVGRVTASRGVRLLDADGAEIDVARAGWDHLRENGPGS